MVSRRSGTLVDAFELGIAFATVVVDGDGLEVAGVFDDEVDGGAVAFRCVDGGAKEGGGEGATVDGDDLEAGGEAVLVADTTHDDVADGAAGADGEAERVGCAETVAFIELRPVVGPIGVDEMVAGESVDAGHLGGVELIGVEAGAKEGGPVVGDHGVEAVDDVVEGVGHDLGWGVAAEAFEGSEEVIEALLAVGLLADGLVDLEPEEVAFAIVVDVAAPVVVGASGVVEDLRGGGGVLEVAPGAAGTSIVEVGSYGGEAVAEDCRGSRCRSGRRGRRRGSW